MADDVVIFSSLNLAEVHLVRSMLTGEGIVSHMRRQHLAPLAGEIPVDDARIELLAEPAVAVVAEALIEASARAAAIERPCPTCGEFNPGSFELCWQCGGDLALKRAWAP